MMPCTVMVMSKIDVIKHMLSKPVLNGHNGKWTIALSKFSLQYVSMKAVKGQVIADFLADHPCLEVDQVNLVKIKPWQLYFDGSRLKVESVWEL